MKVKEKELQRFMNMHRGTGGLINLNPIQRGGMLPEDARDTLNEWCDGYSICDFCNGVLDCIKSPPIWNFIHETLPRFIDASDVRLTGGARESKFMVMHALCKPDDSILVDANAHYTTHLAAERNGLRVYEVANSGYPEYRINEDEYAERIEQIKSETGDYPKIAFLTYPDGSYGNLVNARKVGKISHGYDIPLLLNAAYAMGRMPLSMKKVNADFIVGSGHKSMASSGPIGILGVSDEWKEVIFRKSKHFKNKEIELLGCGPRGLPTITLMASFPHVVERVGQWSKEIENARYFSKEFGELGLKQLGENPHNHDLMFFETPVLYEIAGRHKKGRFFLYRELKKRGIGGIKPGLTKNFKLSTYLLKREEIMRVIDAFKEIVDL